ncbi:MAG TPA: hypothetical protein VFE99_04620 [Agromyces sp.]|nr:hypothetical protein [Agromyces sp.]
MLLMIVCGGLLAAGIVAAVVWGTEPLDAPATPELLTRDAETRAADVAGRRLARHVAGLRLYVWWATVFTVIGTVSGLLVTGAGGRLIMRALAATSPEATGRLTEAHAAVGDISFEGTFAYLLFGALPFAFASAALYLLVAPWLPHGRLAGPMFGLLLFVAVSPFIDPLRADNVDFDIVGPGWLAVTLFALLAVLQGAVLAAIAGRLSRSLPLITRRNWAAAAAPLLAAVVLFPIGAVLAFAGLVAFAFPRALPWLLTARASRRGVIVGRILIAVAVLVALPAFIGAVVSIWGR